MDTIVWQKRIKIQQGVNRGGKKNNKDKNVKLNFFIRILISNFEKNRKYYVFSKNVADLGNWLPLRIIFH